MTPAQHAILERIDRERSLNGNKIPTATREVMVKNGWIEECVRMYFGPREWAYKLTKAGRDALAKARERRRKAIEKGTKR